MEAKAEAGEVDFYNLDAEAEAVAVNFVMLGVEAEAELVRNSSLPGTLIYQALCTLIHWLDLTFP